MAEAASLVLLLALAALAWFLVPFALRKLAERRLARRCAAQRAIVLSYDDGPGSELTPRLLDLLRESGARASFYALGRNLARNPATIRRALAEGHDVGSHTFNHSNAWKTTPWRAAFDLEAGIESVVAEGGSARAFRPPYGKLTVAGLVHGAWRGLTFGWWTIDSRDSWARRPIDDVVAEIERKGGGVVLMHDFDSYEKAPARPSHGEHVLELTRRIIALAREKGFRIVTYAGLHDRVSP